MREIKFRGKRLDNGEWVCGNYAEFVNYLDGAGKPGIQVVRQVPSDFDRMVPAFETELIEVDPATVGQFTGLTDRNGKEIYEGDILSRKDWGMGGGHDPEEFYEVQPLDYYLDEGEQHWHFRVHLWGKYCEVVGNVHDNPELAKEV